MTEPIQNYARIGIVHFMAYKQCLQGEGPIIETLEKIALDPYFQVVEVSHMKDASVRKEAADLLRSAHIDVAFGAQPILLVNKLDLNALDEKTRLEAVDAHGRSEFYGPATATASLDDRFQVLLPLIAEE